ncbi:sodium/calcium exchanger [Caenispirillum salinarum AK4]|uniref:Sodium/calcium exchanger n=1 Tax=Caenispirillum salinarum AK4 TaxID=1238182 RepID=K9H8A8_9PROT|nr:calcium/sodium antiporter [Caenispirillum salinarum]EKV26848.1 sodium/calcium exchanger [Caenispirillum salinarum AK4]
MTFVFLGVGLLLLFVGGELLVRGAVRLAEGLGISPLVIGLTVVGFGTSTPEMVTSIQAALAETPGIAIGNIVGSNIANILLILGLSAVIFPIVVQSVALKRDGAIMLGVAVVFSLLAAAFPLTRPVGIVFVAVLAGYVFYVIRQERRAAAAAHGAVYDKALALEGADPALVPRPVEKPSRVLPVIFCVVGLALLIGGGKLLVDNAVALAQQMGISDTVIGLTIVAVGTSLPELVTSLIAAVRQQADVAFGNIVGSNIYNIPAIGGITAVIAPVSVPPQIVTFDNPAMIVASLLLLLFAWTGLRIRRLEGALLVAAYAVYVYLIWP